MSESVVSASDWIKGITLSIAASIIGGASKLSIRKSWIMVEHLSSSSYPQSVNESTRTSSTAATSPSLSSSPRSDDDDDDEAVELSPSEKRRRKRSDIFEQNALHPVEEEEDDDDDDEEDRPSSPSSTSSSNSNTALELLPQQQQQQQKQSFSLEINPSPNQIPSSIRTTTRTTNNKNITTNPQHHHHNQKIHFQAKLLRYSGMFGMTVLNPLCCVLAMNYASPSILAPFSGLTLVWIVLFAEMLIGERPSKVQLMAAGLIVCGQVVVAIWGDHKNDGDVLLEDLIQSYKDPYFILFFILLAIWMIFIFTMIYNGPPILRRFAWGVSGGSITGLQNFLKDFLTILKASHAENITPPIPLMLTFFVCGASSAFGGLLLLTACMKRYDATYSASMFVVSFVISASIMSAVHYDTFQNLEKVVNYVMYPVGLCTLLFGALILVWDTSSSGGNDDDVEEIRFREMVEEDEEEMELERQADGSYRRVSSFDLKRPLVKHNEESICERFS